MMRKYVNPNLTVIALSETDVLCASSPMPSIDNNVPGRENETPVLPVF